jgi:radical SAM-linked protein
VPRSVAPSPDGPPPAPTVQRLRLRYARRGRLRFTSHRDFQRSFERALRRAGVPMAYSGGFTPHPKISYAGAAPTGVASEAEYLEIGLTAACDPEAVVSALDASLPPGLDVLEAVPATGGGLADRLQASVYEIRLEGVCYGDANAAVEALLSRDEVLVDRMTKNGIRTFDARGPVVSMTATPGARAERGEVSGDQPCAILKLIVRHVVPAVRPDDVLVALRLAADLVPPVPPLVTRLAQGPLDIATGTVADPLVPDRG